jgi:hypothetical protein
MRAGRLAGSRRRGSSGGVLAFQQDHGGGIGEAQRITQLKRAQRAGFVPVQAERPNPDGPDLQRQREDRRSSDLACLRREPWPAADRILVVQI